MNVEDNNNSAPTAIIADFGVAKSDICTELNVAIVGSTGFIAPEIISGTDYKKQSDVGYQLASRLIISDIQSWHYIVGHKIQRVECGENIWQAERGNQ